MILHPREKITMLRKKYDITQKELGQEEFSQSYIASLENGQRDLSEDNLKFICESFNNILKKKNIEESIDFEWLKRPFEEEKKIFFENLMKEIITNESVDFLQEKFKILESLKDFMTIEEKALNFHTLAYKFMICERNDLAYEVYDSIYLIFNEVQDTELLGKIINNFLVIMKNLKIFNRFKNIVELFEEKANFIEKRIKIYSIDSLIEISFYLGDYEKEYHFLKILEELCSYKKWKVLVLNRLQLLIDSNQLSEAKKLYKKIKEDEFFDKYRITLNLIALELFLKLEKKSEVRAIYGSLYSEEQEFSDSGKNLVLAKTALYLKKQNEAIIFYENYIKCIFLDEINIKNRVELYDAVKFLLKHYKKIQVEKVEKIFIKFLEFDKETYDFMLAFLLLQYFVENKFYDKYFLYNQMIINRIEANYVK